MGFLLKGSCSSWYNTRIAYTAKGELHIFGIVDCDCQETNKDETIWKLFHAKPLVTETSGVFFLQG